MSNKTRLRLYVLIGNAVRLEGEIEKDVMELERDLETLQMRLKNARRHLDAMKSVKTTVDSKLNSQRGDTIDNKHINLYERQIQLAEESVRKRYSETPENRDDEDKSGEAGEEDDKDDASKKKPPQVAEKKKSRNGKSGRCSKRDCIEKEGETAEDPWYPAEKADSIQKERVAKARHANNGR